ncbi:MAG: exopolyphosphatase [Bacteroidetes bacterium]|nr:exopolyphosphatase [Bacteroidota bacterium]MBU1371342.1 exopolyphosphatase [Bacteroidota bacterium]MBU1485829.1 exopolyphosphatase [Bacteroidota bacterium]MBU1761091.1 exopolyphosphatase [Bacteroidota bacterium]MBU2268156.1 exopolyphosphatase [Bacteroidota bacterium]
MRYAAIDIGSNAVRLLIAEITNNEGVMSFKKNTLIRVPLRLGDNAFLDHRISEKKAEDLIKTMVSFKNLMDVYKVSDYMACATSALREAENGAELVTKIKAIANLNLQIVAGQEEANIIYASHIEQTLDRKKSFLYIDVGGGSTELSIFDHGEMKASHSFDLGTIRILDNQDKDETWDSLKEWLKEETKNYKNIAGIGTGGNINKLFRLAEEKEGTPLSYTKLKNLYNYLNSYSLKDRINVLGLNQDRADVIIPASEIFLTVMKWANIKHVYVPKVGLVDGIIQTLIDKNFGIKKEE